MRRDWDLKDEALGRTLWRTRFGRGDGLVVRQCDDDDMMMMMIMMAIYL
jgi:hypothetical protein